MSEHPVVGPLFSLHLLERSVLAVLRQWLPGYLTIACELNDIPEGIEGIKSWGMESDLPDDWPSQGMPSLLVVSSGTIDDPEENGGSYAAEWRVDVVVTVKAATGSVARRYAQTYGAAIRGAILQRRSLGESGQRAVWKGETPGLSLPDEDDPATSLCSVLNRFAIRRDEVVSWRRGPGPDGPSIPDRWPTVKDTEIETEIQQP
jgi:hypothetical protein